MSITYHRLRWGVGLPFLMLSACLAGGPWYTGRGQEVLKAEGITVSVLSDLHEGKAGVPVDVQMQLSRHADFHVRCVIAAYRAARTDILESLSYDQDERVRLQIGFIR